VSPTIPAIRAAVDVDSGEVLTVLRAGFVTEAQLHDDPHIDPLTETLDELRTAIASGNVLVAVAGGRIIATARAQETGGIWHISRIAVVPDLQGQGIGSAMLRAVEAAAPAEVEEFEIATGPRSVRNVALYQRHGYLQVPSETNLIQLRKKRETS
jgi:ribosomal protein S18 acetylase RimI-like enzyme